MPANVIICDGDRKSVVEPREAAVFGWGRPRWYGPKAGRAVEAYYTSLRAAALEARELFRVRREEARAAFHAEFPTGVLPDEPGTTEEAVSEAEETKAKGDKPKASASVDDPR